MSKNFSAMIVFVLFTSLACGIASNEIEKISYWSKMRSSRSSILFDSLHPASSLPKRRPLNPETFQRAYIALHAILRIVAHSVAGKLAWVWGLVSPHSIGWIFAALWAFCCRVRWCVSTWCISTWSLDMAWLLKIDTFPDVGAHFRLSQAVCYVLKLRAQIDLETTIFQSAENSRSYEFLKFKYLQHMFKVMRSYLFIASC